MGKMKKKSSHSAVIKSPGRCTGNNIFFKGGLTAKRPSGAEAVNANIQGRSTPFGAKKGGGQLQTKNIIRALPYDLCLYSLSLIRYMAFFIESLLENFGSHL